MAGSGGAWTGRVAGGRDVVMWQVWVWREAGAPHHCLHALTVPLHTCLCCERKKRNADGLLYSLREVGCIYVGKMSAIV